MVDKRSKGWWEVERGYPWENIKSIAKNLDLGLSCETSACFVTENIQNCSMSQSVPLCKKRIINNNRLRGDKIGPKTYCEYPNSMMLESAAQNGTVFTNNLCIASHIHYIISAFFIICNTI